MSITLPNRQKRQEGAIIAYFIMVAILVSAIACLAAYVTQTVKNAQRRSDMIRAREYAQGGALVAAADLDAACTNRSGGLCSNLLNSSKAPYTLEPDSSTAEENLYQRKIATPFSNQTVSAQIWIPNAPAPPEAKVVTTAKVGEVTQTATLHLKMQFGYPAAIISDHPGTKQSGTSKGVGQLGNVVVSGGKGGPIVVDGGDGLAIRPQSP